MISIPRDLYVYIPGYTMQRVNTAYLFGDYLSYPGGGIALLKDTILYNFGITIHHYALIEMQGFENLVDTLGGVDIHVACPYTDWRLKSPELYQYDENNWHLYTVSPGVVHANGEFALWYARSRKRSSDFDRSRRQQEVLRAIFRKILSLDLIPRIPALYSDLTSMVQTDLGVGDLISLAPLAFRIDLSRVRSRFIGTDQVRAWRTPTGGAVQLPRPGAIEALLQDALYFEDEDFLSQSYVASVEVINASSYADWATLAAERLIYAGFDVDVSSDSASPSASSQLIDYGLGTGDDLQRLLTIMNLTSSSTITQPDLNSAYTYRLFVGNDFSPCFNPTTHQGNP
jgi:LCP family protein required for cell wall assembly